MYRYVCMMATLDRQRLLDSGRKDEIEALVDAARNTMGQVTEEGSA